MKPTLSILVVSYNTREMTLACLRSVFEQTTRTPFELIVVDNASTDGSGAAIEAEFGSRITYIASEVNMGFARANNLAAERADGAYILLLNPDTVVLDGAIDKLVQFASERPDAGIWGGRTVFADGTLNPASCWGRPTLWSLLSQGLGLTSLFRRSSFFNPESYGGWRRDSVREVDIVSGCFFLIRRELWNCLGGFDQRFFMYGEEADLCIRARACGVNPLVTPHATIVHYGGASERARGDKLVRLLAAKSQLLRAHWSQAHQWVGIRLLECWTLSRAIVWRGLALMRGERASGQSDAWSEAWRRRVEWSRVPAARGALTMCDVDGAVC